jgi:signal transduction histidine kinase
MNGTKIIQPDDSSIGNAPYEYCRETGNANVAARAIEPDDFVPVDVRLEHMQKYTTYLEEIIVCKNSEISELQKIMELRIEEMRQQQIKHESLIIHPARQAAMGEMLSTIAHQWRQPLQVISLAVQNMKDAWEYGEFNGELLDRSVFKTMEQVMYLSRTIDDFSSFLKPVKATEYFNPILCIEESVGLLSGWFSGFPAIEMRKAGEAEATIRISGCQNAFKQVVLNVLNNANDAIQEQKRRIGQSFQGLITISIQRREENAVISIADNGGGINESVKEHIFEPYFSTKDKANGIGIGLYVSRLIIENSMNGSIRAENTPEGALFGIILPVTMVDGG